MLKQLLDYKTAHLKDFSLVSAYTLCRTLFLSLCPRVIGKTFYFSGHQLYLRVFHHFRNEIQIDIARYYVIPNHKSRKCLFLVETDIMELFSFSVSTPFWIWLLFALATAYYYDIMKKRINRLEQRLLDLDG